MKLAPILWSLAVLAWTTCAQAGLEITEFSANSNGSFPDVDGEASDWIELQNTGNIPVSTSGYSLTDENNELSKWPLPAITLGPGEFLIVFATGNDRRDPGQQLHANFSLRASSGYLALVEPGELTVATEFDYPKQFYGLSYGAGGYFSNPTAGAPNGPADFTDFVRDTKFSVDRGFFDSTFGVELTSDTTDAEIYYTTDGTAPTRSNGELYSRPIPIRTTTTLRAVATKPGLVSSNVDTQTYIFPAEVIRQPAAPGGFPSTWGIDNSTHNGATNQPRPADYEMDPDVIARFGTEAVIGALRHHPTISIVMDPDDLWNESTDSATGGIYPNPYGGTGDQFLPGWGAPRDWERPCSAEFIGFEKVSGKQVDCGIRIAGNFARHPNRYKHHLRLTFRREYGPATLDAPLFSQTSVDTFDNLILRGGNSESWTFPGAGGNGPGTRANVQYIRDQFYKDAQGAMGHLSANQEYFHLYLNGLYWGFYTLIERIDSHFMSQHLGGDEEDYDTLKQNNILIDGDRDAWERMFRISRSGLARTRNYEALQDYLDLDNFIDYVLFNFWAGTADWRNNWRGGRLREPGAGFMFFMWDGERGLGDRTPRSIHFDSTGTNREWSYHATELHHDLKANPEYRMRFSDRLHMHLFNDGVLTPENSAAMYNARAEEIKPSLVAESARWGDRQRPDDPYTTENEWQDMLDFMNEEFFPGRTPILLAQLRATGVYPAIDPPVFSQHGGQVTPGFPLQITGRFGEILYTTDGSDPRLEGGAVNPSAATVTGSLEITTSTRVRARVFGNGEWSALTDAVFLTELPASRENLVISEIFYNPVGPSEEGEFIELLNIAGHPISLAGARFEAGIQYAFGIDDRLGPGERLVLTPADYTGFLANGGEPLSLIASDGTFIRKFRYNDNAPWPESPDGEGFSLVLAHPSSNPDHASAVNWLPSAEPGGTPGTSDAAPHQPGANLIDFYLGVPALDLEIVEDQAVLKVRRNLLAQHAGLTVETSQDLVHWTTGEAVFLGFESRSGPFATMTWNLPRQSEAGYARLRVLVSGGDLDSP